jgi:hypothetical protein
MRALSLLLILTAACWAEAPRKTLIDEYLFGKMERDKIPHAPIASDSEFVRRVTLDLTGRLPTPNQVRAFLKDTDPDKRDKLVDSLIPPVPTEGVSRRKEEPFLDRWTYFFNELFRNNAQNEQGIPTFYRYIYKALELNIPYDDFVRDMLTANALSNWTTGPANLISRNRVMEGDGYRMNHEDTCDEIAIWTARFFLGVNLECISCHDGARHLDKINLWLSHKKRTDLWDEAAFFGKTSIGPVFGRQQEFVVRDIGSGFSPRASADSGYALDSKSSLRMPRYKAEVSPAFILTGERPAPGEREREAYARLLTSSPQFARATVNLFWAELMGRGIVDPPFGFDLDRQDPKNPPPAPWTIQPTHPELLNALAEDFQKHGFDLRYLMKLITKSTAYQLSAEFGQKWQERYDDYFARRIVRRLGPEQFWDAVQQATGNFEEFPIKYTDLKRKYILQANFLDFAQNNRLAGLLVCFGQTDREDGAATERSSLLQAANLLNNTLVLDRVKAVKGSRLEKLLSANKSDKEIVEELFLATISRYPTAEEEQKSLHLLASGASRQEAAEDLMWALLNRLEFVFNR